MTGNMEKARNLWFLLQGVDRNDPKALQLLTSDKEQYPYFYLLNWNEKMNEDETRKVSLQSNFPRNYRLAIQNAVLSSSDLKAVDHNGDEEVVSQQEIIDQFLEKLPNISKPKRKEDDDPEAEVDFSNQSFDLPVSETFGKILMKQGKYVLAIEVFEQLSLKFPEKKTYFASLIKESNEKLTEL